MISAEFRQYCLKFKLNIKYKSLLEKGEQMLPRMQPKSPDPRREKNQKYQQNNRNQQPSRPQISQMKTNRGEAIRSGRRNMETADKAVDRWKLFEKHHEQRANFIPLNEPEKIRIVPLGGQGGIGEKNMIVLELEKDALILDCGFDLSVDLPGVNFAIPATEYLESIKHKIRGYVISHGHMDHIGALPYIVPKFPAPIYGSHFTNGMVQKQFEGAVESGIEFTPECINMTMDNHERLVNGPFTIELVRITH